MDKKTEQLVDNIFNTLQRQRFADFYSDNGSFGKWLTGTEDAPSAEQVKQELAKLFELI